MHNFKKCIVSLLTFSIIFSAVSGVVIYIFFNTESAPYQDIGLRNELAGSIDTLLLGSSEGMVAFNSEIIDKELNVTCYNLCGSACPPSGIKALFEEEIKRNPLKTVIIDVGSFLHYDFVDSVSEGEIKVIPRLADNSKRFKYMLKNIWINNYSYLYATYMNNGISTLKNLLAGTYVPAVTGKVESNSNNDDIVNKTDETAVDLSLNNNEILNEFVQDKTVDLNKFWGKPEERNFKLLKEILEKCNEKKAKVFLVFVPATESRIWRNGNFETEKEFYNNFAKENGCTYLDFNLLKNRNEFFSDKTSFKDHYHISASGSQVFSKCLADILNKLNSGEDVSDMFYSSYDEAIKHFEYYDIYQKMIREQK